MMNTGSVSSISYTQNDDNDDKARNGSLDDSLPSSSSLPCRFCLHDGFSSSCVNACEDGKITEKFFFRQMAVWAFSERVCRVE